MLEVKSLCAGYGKKAVLQQLTAAFPQGQLISILGPNGAGKSTLLKAVMGQLPATGGEILLDGRQIRTMQGKALARELAWLPQAGAPADMTVEQLVLQGRYPYLRYPRGYAEPDYRAAQRAMEQLELTPLARQPLSTLSGGMLQKARIAMALCQDTRYILLDEPTAYLDIAHQLMLMQRLRQLADDGRGILAVMHDLPLAMNFSHRVAVMDAGRLCFFGAPEALLSSGLTEKIFGVALEKGDTGYHYCYH